MKNIHFVICLLFCFTNALAQKPLTLEAAMQLAVQHNYDLQNQQLRIDLVDKDLEKIRARRQPTVGLNGDLRTNPILQSSIIPGEAFTQPGQGEAENRRVQFGTVFNLTFAVDATYQLYNPTYRTDIEINRTENALETATLRKNTLDVKLEAATAYYDLLLQQTQVTLAENRLRRAEDLLAVAQTRRDAGALLPVDLQRSELDVQNAQTLLDQAQNARRRSRLNLARLLGTQPEDLALPAGNALQISPDTIVSPEVNRNLVEGRYEIQEIQQQLAINQLQVRREDKAYLPTVELYGNLSAQHLSNDLAVWDDWFPFMFVGLRASLPIFDGNLKARNKETYQLQSQINRNSLARLREDLTYELQSAAIDLENAISQLQDARRNLQSARDILATDQKRYAEGALLFSEFRNTEFSVREAESNFLAAGQNYFLAKLSWMRASGKL